MVFPKSKVEVWELIRHPLALGSFMVFASTLFGNVFAYLFNLLAARLLGPSDYSVLASVIALISVTGVLSVSLSSGLTKFVSGYKGQGRPSQIGALLREVSRVFFLVGFLVFLLAVLGKNRLAVFFNINDPNLLVIVGLMIWVSFLQTINLGALTGLQNFSFLSLVSFLGSFGKFLLGLGLIILGFRVMGAVVGIVVTVFVVYFLSFLPLRSFYRDPREAKYQDWRKLLVFILPAIFSMWAVTSLTSSDVIMAKRYFSDYDAGIYAFTALVGRVIFFASSSLTLVMFPLVSERAESGRKYKHLLIYTLSTTLLISVVLDGFYFIFPEFTLRFFSGFGKTAYLAGAGYVGFLGLYFVLFSICNSLITYFLSLHKTLVASIFPFIAAALQLVLISFFHQSFWEVIFSSLTSVTLLLVSFLLYFFFDARKS